MITLERGVRPEPAEAAAAALVAARRASAGWTGRSLAARAAVLRSAAGDLAVADGLVDTIASTSARSRHEVWSAELLPTVDALRWLAGPGRAALQPQRLRGSGLQWYFRAARHELHWDPLGVVGIVSPSNSLLFLPLSQIAGVLLGGNAVVWKPAPGGTAIAHAVLGILTRAGLPADVLQVVPGDAEMACAIARVGVDKLFFTGGAPAGLALYRLQAETGRPAVLELSGRHVAVVLADAPLVETARGLVWGKLANHGRNCLAVQLVLVERPWALALVAALGEALADASPDQESLPPAERLRLQGFIAEAVAAGARIAYAGPDGGLPAVLADVAPGMRVTDEEVQGPILAVATVDAAEQAVGRINESPWRLSASVWSASVPRARQLAARLDVGQVWINDVLHPAAQPAVPLAGRGRSGFGASRGLAGLRETVQPKVVSVMPRWASRRHHRLPHPATPRLFAETARLAVASGLRARLAAALALLRVGVTLMRSGR